MKASMPRRPADRTVLVPGAGRLLSLLGLLWLALAAWIGGRPFALNVGGGYDGPFVEGFFAPEANPQVIYRWSHPRAWVRAPGRAGPWLVVLDAVAYRPDGVPPDLAFLLDGRRLPVPASPGRARYAFLLPGPVQLGWEVAPFTPSGDPRELGLLTVGVRWRPVPPEGRIAPWVPLLGLGVLGALWLGLAGLGLGAAARGLGTAGALLLLARYLAVRGPELALYLPRLLALTAGLALAAWLGGRRLASPHGRRAWAALLLTVALRLGAILHPQFLASDTIFHYHNWIRTLQGRLLFRAGLPDGGPLVPYPPAGYLLLTPLAVLTEPAPWIVLAAHAAAAAALIAGVWAAAVWAGRPGWGGWAALLATTAPFWSQILHWGVHSEAWAEVWAWFLLAFLATGRNDRRGRPLLLAVLAGVLFLSHLGVTLWTLPVLGLWALWEGIERRREGRPLGPFLLRELLPLALALLFALVVYYVLLPPQPSGSDVEGARLLPWTTRLVGALRFRLWTLVGAPLWLLGGLGLPRALRDRRLRPLLGAVLLSLLPFLAAEAAVGMSVRYQMGTALALALAGGAFLDDLARRRSALAWLLALAALAWGGFRAGEILWTMYHEGPY